MKYQSLFVYKKGYNLFRIFHEVFKQCLHCINYSIKQRSQKNFGYIYIGNMYCFLFFLLSFFQHKYVLECIQYLLLLPFYIASEIPFVYGTQKKKKSPSRNRNLWGLTHNKFVKINIKFDFISHQYQAQSEARKKNEYDWFLYVNLHLFVPFDKKKEDKKERER